MSDTKSRGAGFDDEAVEALLAGHLDAADDPLASVLAELRATAVRPVPEPSLALAELLANGLPADELAERRRRRRTIITGAVFIGATSLTLSGVAAAHDALPGPMQRVMSGIINAVTPFSVDEPRDGVSNPRPVTTPTPVGTPVSSAATGANDHRGATSGSGTGDRDTRSGSSDSGGDGSGSSDGDTSGDSSGPAETSASRTTSSDGGGSDGGGSGSDGGSSDGGSASPSPSLTSSASTGSDGGGGGSDGSDSGGFGD